MHSFSMSIQYEQNALCFNLLYISSLTCFLMLAAHITTMSLGTDLKVILKNNTWERRILL